MKQIPPAVEKTGFFTTILQHLGLHEPTPVADSKTPGAMLASKNDITYFLHPSDHVDILEKELKRMWNFHTMVKDNSPTAREQVLRYVRTVEEFRSGWGARQLTAVRKITNTEDGVKYEFSFYSATNKLLGYSDFHIKH